MNGTVFDVFGSAGRPQVGRVTHRDPLAQPRTTYPKIYSPLERTP